MRHASNSAALFVCLTIRTHNNKDVLCDDQLRQAAYQAIIVRTRFQRCPVLAIGGTPRRIDLVMQYTPSLPVTALVQICREAASEAITRQSAMLHGCQTDPAKFWQRSFAAHSLSADQAQQAEAYLEAYLETHSAQQGADYQV